MLRIATGDLVDGEFGRRDDGRNALGITILLRPAQLEPSASLLGRDVGASELGQAQPGGLKNRRDGRTNDVFAMLGKLGMTARGKAG